MTTLNQNLNNTPKSPDDYIIIVLIIIALTLAICSCSTTHKIVGVDGKVTKFKQPSKTGLK